MKIFLQPVKLPPGLTPEMKEFPQGRRSVLVGSSVDCDVVIPNDAIDSEHANFLRLPNEGNWWNVIDLHTRRGVDVVGPDDTKIELKPHEPIKIGAGYKITLGGVAEYVLLNEGSALPTDHQMYPTLKPPDELEIEQSAGIGLVGQKSATKIFVLAKTSNTGVLEGSPKVVLTSGEVLTLGRAKENNGKKHLQISGDERVSKIHCSITNESGQLIVRDNGSTNGIFVNNPEKVAKKDLKDGDTLIIGKTAFMICCL